MSPTPQTCEPSKLYLATIKGKWEEVVKIYEEERETAWLKKMTSSKDTVLHMAINEEKEDTVEKLVSIIEGSSHNEEAEMAKKALKAQNESGDTPLHRAAAGGSVKMCEHIIKAGKNMGLENQDLLIITNEWGHNPLMVATLNNRKHVFFYFASKVVASVEELEPLLRSSGNGDTVLHAAIKTDNYDLAFHMIKIFPDQLLDKCNSKGMTPLHVLANKAYAFKSGYHLNWWKYLIYYLIRVEPLKYDPNSITTDQRSSNTDKYLIFSGEKQRDVDPENPNSSNIKGNIPRNYDTCFQLLVTVYLNFVNILGFVVLIKDVIRARHRNIWSEQLLDEILKHPDKAYLTKNDGGQPSDLEEEFGHDTLPMSLRELKNNGDQKENQKETGKSDEDEHVQGRIDTVLLVAAKKGVVEVVRKILQQLPLAIHDTSSMNNRNIMMIAAENRRPTILYELKKYLNNQKLWYDLVQAVDTDENTMLHLAAYYDDKDSHAWKNQGSALQMQRETKWYEYVSSLVPPHFAFLANKREETPWQIFISKHESLVKESGDWLKETAESCSVVAALVAGVTFASSSQVPGGTQEDNGKPNLEGVPAFELFAVTALLGLCFSVTSLVMFLSILTDRKQAKDFKWNLPLKLFIGLSSLFVSIASMLISFCAAYFFVLNDKFKDGLYPLYAVTCFPLTIYAMAQFPLYMDLLKATISIVPQLHNFPRLYTAVVE